MNIYTKNREKHIGKRYAAGIWCWPCKTPLFDKERRADFGFKLLDSCPSCGNIKLEEKMTYNPVFRELGFDKKEPAKPTGIDGASGFIWCIDEYYGLGTTKTQILSALQNHPEVETEYGDIWPLAKFTDMFLQVIEEKYSDGEFS